MWYINVVVIPRLFVLLNCCPIWCRYNGLFTNQLQHSPPWKFPCRHPAWGFPWILVCSLGESTLLVRAALQPIKVAWRPSNPQTKQFYSTNEARSAVLLAMCWMCVAKWLRSLEVLQNSEVYMAPKCSKIQLKQEKWIAGKTLNEHMHMFQTILPEKWKTERDARCLKNKAVARSFTTLGPDLSSAELSLKAEFYPWSPATWNQRQHCHSYDEGIFHS